MNNKMKKIILYTAFGVYALLMLWLLFGQRMGGDAPGTYWERLSAKVNLIPFRTIAEFAAGLSSAANGHAVINLFGNVIMFVPLGFFIPGVFRKADTFRRSMLHALITIGCIEITQLVTLLGSLDVDDLILNMIGAAVGYWLYRLLTRFMKGKSDV